MSFAVGAKIEKSAIASVGDSFFFFLRRLPCPSFTSYPVSAGARTTLRRASPQVLIGERKRPGKKEKKRACGRLPDLILHHQPSGSFEAPFFSKKKINKKTKI